MAVFSALGMLAGYGRDAAVAAWFGASASTDAFFVATIIPMSIATVAISGTLAPALLPVLSGRIAASGPGSAAEGAPKPMRDVWAITDVVITVAIVGLLVLSGLSIVGAPALVRWMAPGFDAPTSSLAIHLVVATAPMLLLLGLAGVLGAIANAMRSFAVPAVSPALGNAIALLAIVLLGTQFGIHAAAVGLVAGALLQASVQIVALYRSGWRYRPSLDLRLPAIRDVAGLFVPLAAFVALAQAVPIVERVVGSTFETGQLSLLTYASKLYLIPVIVLASSLATVLFPLLAVHQRREDVDHFVATLQSGMRHAIFLAVPAFVWLWFLAPVLVGLVLERGAFTAAETAETGALLRRYALAVIPATGLLILTRAFHARRDMITPLWLGVVNTAFYVAAALLLSHALGLHGLPLAFAASQVLGSAMCAGMLARGLGVPVRELLGRGLAAELGGVAGAGLALTLLLAAAAHLVGPRLVGVSAVVSALALSLSLAASAALYLVLAHGLGVRESVTYLDALGLRRGRHTERVGRQHG